MSYFANVPSITDGKGVVARVIIADQDFINSGAVGDPFQWIETSYNTRGNVLYLPDSNIPDPDQSKKLRGNYAGIGSTYDAVNDVFYAAYPGPGWVLDVDTWLWVQE